MIIVTMHYAMREISEFDRVDRLADSLFSVGAGRELIGYQPLDQQIGMRRNHLGGQLSRAREQSGVAADARWSALCVSTQTRPALRHFCSLTRTLRYEYQQLSDRERWERQRCYDAAPAEPPVMAAISHPRHARPVGNSVQERTRSC
jgi:hypothetical protein